jgi:tyrosyl-tRNA synthetase
MYPLLQGYDSVEIDADVEIGGTDQKFNLLFGRDMQSAFEKPQQSIMTLPILPGIDGVKKMSKSTGNYIGVTEPPEEMFGKVMRIPDANLEEYWQLLLSEDPPMEKGPNEAKRELARRLVARFHGEEASAAAEEHFNRLFVRHEAPEEVDDLRFGEDPVHLPALVAAAFDVSRSEARRSIAQGGVKLDGETLPPEPLDYPANELDGRVLQLGKRRFRRLVNVS